MSEFISLAQTQEYALLEATKVVFSEKTFHICNYNKKEEAQEDQKRYFNPNFNSLIVLNEDNPDILNNEKDNFKKDIDNKFIEFINKNENTNIYIIDPILKHGIKNIEKSIDIIEKPQPKENEKNCIIQPSNKELDSSLNLHQKNIKDNAFMESKVELDKFKNKEKEELENIFGDENNLFLALNNNLETRYDNKFKEVKETEHYITDEEFKIFSPPDKKNKLRYLEKPIFQTVLGHKRKSMSDLMRKKQKTNVTNNLIVILNSKLKEININYEFKLPQTMITNVSKTENAKYLDMTLKEILIERYFDKDKEKNIANIIVEENNKKILKLLEEEDNENLNEILHMNMSEIYAEFFRSAEFRKYIEKLEKNDESYEYIYKYIKVAEGFVEFYGARKSENN